jgi:murein tripeptide amidase MpaA
MMQVGVCAPIVSGVDLSEAKRITLGKIVSDDLIQITVEGSFPNIKQALSGLHGVDYGCRCCLKAVSGARVSMSVFVPSRQIGALQQVSGPLSVSVAVGRNASADGRDQQARVMRALSAGVTRLRGRGAVPSGTASPDIISTYLSTDLINSEFQGLATAHPTLCSVITLPYKSVQGRTIYLYRLGVQGTAKSRGVLFTACAHAREWGGAEICLSLAADLLDAYQGKVGLNYGAVSYTAAQIVQILTTVDLFILPCINPDGRIYSMTPAPDGDPLWRQNRNNSPVDLNRNYDFLWNFRADFDPTVANGTYPNEQVPPAWDNASDPRWGDLYHGPSPVSEPECKNVVWVFDQFPRIGYLIDIHSFTGDFLYSWGDAPDQSGYPNENFSNPAYNGKRGVTDESVYAEYIKPEDQFLTKAMATNFVSAVKAVRGSNYLSRQDFLLAVAQAAGPVSYPTSGALDDYAFSRGYKSSTAAKIYSFTLEFGLEFDFHPGWPEMGSIIEEIDAGLMSFCLTPPDPCAYLEQHAQDLEDELQSLQDGFDDGEIPEPRTPANVAGFEAELRNLRLQVVAANKAAQNCRNQAARAVAAVQGDASQQATRSPIAGA